MAAAESGTIPRGRALAGAAALIACVQYFVAEAVAVSAWRDPPYSYTRNYISDLGIPGCGDPLRGGAVCSPLAVVMNTGFVLAGVLCLAAALLLAPLIRQPSWRRIVVGLACAHAAGSILVGLVHSAPGTAVGTPRAHIAGAYLAILGGNLMIGSAGLAARRSGVPAWFGATSVGLCGVAIAAGAGLIFVRGLPPGLLERLAVDLITVWEVTAGLLLAVVLRRGGGGGAVALSGLSRPIVGPAT